MLVYKKILFQKMEASYSLTMPAPKNNAACSDLLGEAFALLYLGVQNQGVRKKLLRERKPQHKSCDFCGSQHSPQKEQCPAWGQRCLGCGGRNHFKTVCRKSKPRVNRMAEQPSDDSDLEWLAGIAVESHVHAVDTQGYAKEIYTEMTIDDKPVKFQVDCGVSTNILSDKYVYACGMAQKSSPSGRRQSRYATGKTRYSVEFIVVNGDLLPLLGARVAQQMKLISVNEEKFTKVASPAKTRQSDVNHLTTAEEIVQKYDCPLGALPGTVHLEVDPDVTPVITPVRRVPIALKESLKQELDRYVNMGILEPVEEPTTWVSGIAVAKKKSGALRICIDPRPLNKVLRRETFQPTVLDEILSDLAQVKVFSTVDLQSGYWHCVLDKELSEIFQNRVNQALEGLHGASLTSSMISWSMESETPRKKPTQITTRI